jgi:hypothetical protein
MVDSIDEFAETRLIPDLPSFQTTGYAWQQKSPGPNQVSQKAVRKQSESSQDILELIRAGIGGTGTCHPEISWQQRR